MYEFNPSAFGNSLKNYRKKEREMTLAQLSEEISKGATGLHISPSALHYLEVGDTKTRPSRQKVIEISRALGLATSARQDLLRLAGYSSGTEPLEERATACIQHALQFTEGTEAEEFIEDLQTFCDRFSKTLRRRKESIHIAIIPIAGWQTRVLSSELTEQMLVPAIREAMNAGIKNIVVVTSPKQAPQWHLAEKFKDAELRIVHQDQPLGIGHAILMGWPIAHLGPVAVLLPDEVDPTGQALTELTEQYRRLHQPIIGVNPSPAEKEKVEILRLYGLAVPNQRRVSGQSARLHELKQPLIEKPQEHSTIPKESRKIAGRYILTPTVRDAINVTGPELTNALNDHWKRMYAYELKRDLVALAPYKVIEEKLRAVKL